MNFNDITNPFLHKHLEYVAETEAPKLFHAWAAIGCVAACLGRHLYYDTGIGKMFGNQYILLVGPPGTRKNTAISFATRIIREATGIRWAPDDTGGQRQGLIKSMLSNEYDASEDVAQAAAMLDIAEIMKAELNIGRMDDRHVLFAEAREFGSFVGQNNLDLTRFLIRMWDGDDFEYQLKNTKDKLKDPLLTLLGGTTPDEISMLLPQQAIGQGFMSRIILVYAPHKERIVPPSRMRLNETHMEYLRRTYARIWYEMAGAMRPTPEAALFEDMLYGQDHRINDMRFIFYTERRGTHLRKLAMALAAARGSMDITIDDIKDAHILLSTAEKRMPDALGEYGMSPLAICRQKIIEYLRHVSQPVSDRALWGLMHRDMKTIDYQNTINSLINTERIHALDTHLGRAYMYNDTKEHMLIMGDDVFNALTQKPGATQ